MNASIILFLFQIHFSLYVYRNFTFRAHIKRCVLEWENILSYIYMLFLATRYESPTPDTEVFYIIIFLDVTMWNRFESSWK